MSTPNNIKPITNEELKQAAIDRGFTPILDDDGYLIGVITNYTHEPYPSNPAISED